MPSIFLVKEKLKNPKEWYDNVMGNKDEWEYDAILKKYYTGNVYLLEREDATAFEDMAETEFFGWSTDSWLKVAGEKELIYGHYNSSALEAEFIHIKDGQCIREYAEYDGEIDVNEGVEPRFENWVDVASYVDKKLM